MSTFDLLGKRSKLRSYLAAVVVFVILFSGWSVTAPISAADDDVEAQQDSVIVVEDFESGLAGHVRFDQRRNFSGSMQLESDPEYVRSGNHSVRIDYDYIGVKDNPSYVYIGPSGNTILIEGYPKKIGMWLYGNNDGHIIFSKFRDGNNKSFEVQYMEDEIGVDWTGWKYIEADLPQDKPGPLVLEIYMRIEQTDFDKKNRGTVWVDDVRLIYDELDEDMEVPQLNVVSPLPSQNVSTNLPQLQVQALDAESGIDSDSIQLTIDGVEVDAVYDEQSGLIRYTPEAPLAGGYHEAYLKVRDRAGNPAFIAWDFRIQGGVQFALNAPSEVISNETFELHVQASNTEGYTGSFAELSYDPATLEIVEVTTELTPSEVVQHEFDNIDGRYSLETSAMPASDEALATIRFAVKRSAKMERGELHKFIVMEDGYFLSDAADRLRASAAPHAYSIGFGFNLQVIGSSLHTNSLMRVTDKQGGPVEGVSFELIDPNGPQSYVEIKASEAVVYAEANATSDSLLTVSQGDYLFADTAAAGADYYAVYLPSGQGKGWIAAEAAAIEPLTTGYGVTNADGEVYTPLVTLALRTIQLQAIKGDKISQVMDMVVVPQLGTDVPQFVSTFLTKNPKTSHSIVWQTAPRIEQTVIQYVEDVDFSDFEAANVKELQASSELLVAPALVGELRFHQAILQGLAAGTTYRYRVGYEGHWSEPMTFTTEKAGNGPFSFLFVTDSHTNSENGFNIYQRLMQNAFENYPDSAFVMHGGDVVDDGGKMAEWQQFWRAADLYSGSIPSAYVIGNHDNKNDGKNVFKAAFGVPDNGLEGHKRLTYSFDYGDVHFVALNSEADEADMRKQAAWLRADLEANTKKWTIAMFHRTPYHTENGRGPELVTYYLSPVLEDKGVDLVLVGHDHALAWTYPMKNGLPQKNGGQGTVYLVGGSAGWKFYDAFHHDYLDFLYDDNIPVYSSIKVEANKIVIESRTDEGELLADKTIAKASQVQQPQPPYNWSGVATPPATEENEQGLALRELTASAISEAVAKGQLEWELHEQGEEIRLPFNAAELLQGKELIFRIGAASVIFSAEQLSGIGGGQEANENPIVFTIQRIEGSNGLAAVDPGKLSAQQEVSVANAGKMEQYNAAGDVYKLSLGLSDKDGKWTQLKSDVPVKLKLPVSSAVNPQLAGIYALTENGGKVFTGSLRAEEGFITGEVNANGQYQVFEYKRQYSDVHSGHWAKEIIEVLSAQRILEGIDATRFVPERKVTRAEYIAMMARALRLEGTGSESGFEDVPATAWYAEALAAAREADLVQGDAANRYHPGDSISRQEMTVIAIRAYEYRHGQIEQAAALDFKDVASISMWAKEPIAKAVELGIINGYTNGNFDPSGFASRAEAAKLVHYLFSNS